MSKNKNSKRLFKDFESRTANGVFVRIAKDMMRSKAFSDLSMQQICLYMFFKSEYNPEKSTKGIVVEANDKNILFPDTKWKPLYRGNYRAWRKDRDTLILHGFIELSENGTFTRTPNVYALSSLWKEWPENQEEIRKKFERTKCAKARAEPEE